MLKRNTSGLEAYAQQKRESAIKRTEDAITRLIKDKRPVNFKTVSEESGVSRTWLYKEPEIKDRINQIKNQPTNKYCSKRKVDNKLTNQPIYTSQIDELKTKIKKLETENYALRNHLEVVYGMTEPQLVEKVKILQQENEALKMRLQGAECTFAQADDLKLSEREGSSHEANQQLLNRIHSLELENQKENQKLIKEREQIDQLKTDLLLAQQKLREYEQAKDSSQPKLIVLEQKKQSSIDNSSIIDTIKPRLKDLGVRLNKKLTELIESLEKQQVQNAVSAVEEYLATGKKVKSKAGLLRKALEESWTPNLTDEERVISQTKDTFSEWYKLAKEEGIVQASQGTKKGILVLEPTGEWTPFEAMLEKGWTLEYLEERARR